MGVALSRAKLEAVENPTRWLPVLGVGRREAVGRSRRWWTAVGEGYTGGWADIGYSRDKRPNWIHPKKRNKP